MRHTVYARDALVFSASWAKPSLYLLTKVKNHLNTLPFHWKISYSKLKMHSAKKLKRDFETSLERMFYKSLGRINKWKWMNLKRLDVFLKYKFLLALFWKYHSSEMAKWSTRFSFLFPSDCFNLDWTMKVARWKRWIFLTYYSALYL